VDFARMMLVKVSNNSWMTKIALVSLFISLSQIHRTESTSRCPILPMQEVEESPVTGHTETNVSCWDTCLFTATLRISSL